MKLIMLSLLMLCFVYVPNLNAATWNYTERADYGDGEMPDSYVWYYQSAPAGSTNTAAYENLTYWATSGWYYDDGGPTYPDFEYGTTVGPSSERDAILRFLVPEDGYYTVSCDVSESYPDTSMSIYIQYEDQILNTVDTQNGVLILEGSSIAHAGDSLYIRFNTQGNSFQDRLEINEITVLSHSIPEPASIGLVLFSVSGLILRRAKKA